MEIYQNIRIGNAIPALGAGSMFFGNEQIIGEAIEPIPPTPTIDWSREYFTIISWEDNNTIYYHKGRQSNGNDIVMYMSNDKVNWTDIASGHNVGDLINVGILDKGQKLYFKGTNVSLTYPGTFPYDQSSFWATNKYELCGNLMSLLWGDEFIGKTTLPDYNASCIFQNLVSVSNSDYYYSLLSIRNLVMPCTEYASLIYTSMFERCYGLIYANKEMPQETRAAASQYDLAMFRQTKIQETPVFKLTVNGNSNMYDLVCQDSYELKRSIFLCSSGYPSVPGSPTKYKLSTNTSVSGSEYSDFDTLQSQNALISIWAEAETPYDGYIEGCGDYFVTGDTVTLVATNLNGTGFQGYYENGQLVSSNATYTFTATANRNLIVKFS